MCVLTMSQCWTSEFSFFFSLFLALAKCMTESTRSLSQGVPVCEISFCVIYPMSLRRACTVQYRYQYARCVMCCNAVLRAYDHIWYIGYACALQGVTLEVDPMGFWRRRAVRSRTFPCTSACVLHCSIQGRQTIGLRFLCLSIYLIHLEPVREEASEVMTAHAWQNHQLTLCKLLKILLCSQALTRGCKPPVLLCCEGSCTKDQDHGPQA